jgi:hypothetical protein
MSWDHRSYTECLQKNGAVSKINKKFISHLTRAKRTLSAAATVQVFYTYPSMCAIWVTQHNHTIIEFVPYSMYMWFSPVAARPIQSCWRTRLSSSCTFLWKWGEHPPVAECNPLINFWNRTILLWTLCITMRYSFDASRKAIKDLDSKIKGPLLKSL